MTWLAPERASLSGPVTDVVAQPLIVELIGLAGAGKTTLSRAVVGRIAEARSGLRLHRGRDLPAVAVAAGRLAPAIVSSMLRGSATVVHDARYSLRLLAHRSPATRALRSGSRLVLIDEGPVYMLTRLIAFGSAGVDQRGFGRHWQHSVDWWRQRLDAIVWLDAPDETLAARIRGRTKDHRAKHATDEAIGEFLARYRAAYAIVVRRLAAGGGPRVIRLDSREPVEIEVDRLLTALGLGSRQGAVANGA